MECSGDPGLRVDRSVQTMKTWALLSFLKVLFKSVQGKVPERWGETG